MDGFLKAEEAAAILGLHPTTIHRWCQIGQIPYKRVGWRYFIPEAAVRQINAVKPILPTTEKPFLSVTEAARLLSLSPDTVRAWCRDGHIPARKPHWNWQIPREAVLERMEINNPDSPDAYSPLDLRRIDDPDIRAAVAAGEIPHPALIQEGREDDFDWAAWLAGTLPLQIADAEYHARQSPPSDIPPSGSVALSESRPAILDRLMTNAAHHMAECITLYGAFSNLQILRRVTQEQQPAYIDLLVSFQNAAGTTPFGMAHREIGKRIGILARAAGYIPAPDLDRPARDLFDNPTTEHFFRPPPTTLS